MSTPRPLLLLSHERAATLSLATGTLDADVWSAATLPSAASLDSSRPTVVLLDRVFSSGPALYEQLSDLAEVAALVGDMPAAVGEFVASPHDALLAAFLPANASPQLIAVQLAGAFRHAASLAARRDARAREAQHRADLAELTRVGVALSTERDLLTLLELIVGQARSLTSSDAASLYLVERPTPATPHTAHAAPNTGPHATPCAAADSASGAPPGALRFKLSQNFTLPDLPLQESTVAIDHASLAGYVASTGQPLVIADVALLPDNVTYRPNRSFDERFGYRTKSVLVIPMKTHREEVVGVLQLINRKRTPDARLDSVAATESEVLPFDERSVAVVSALAAQAAVAIENSLLYESIEQLLEGFVAAAVTAIDARDPSTYGHSTRVASLAVGLAESLERHGGATGDGVRFTRAKLRELRYAALLHDFGKVAVREHVLVKEKKLYPADLAAIRHRFECALLSADLAYERQRADALLNCGPERYPEMVEELERTRGRRRAELAGYFEAVLAANEPTGPAEASFDELRRIAEVTYLDHQGHRRPLLTGDDVRALSITRGNLDELERREMEAHVTQTFRFLREIPWTRELRRVPDIALAHHERLDGTGYPHALSGAEVSLEARIVTIADIFDALTAADRSYRRAVSPEYALGVLRAEAAAGAVDAELVELFAAARLWEARGDRRPAGAAVLAPAIA